MQYLAIIAPHSTNPVTIGISKGLFDGLNPLDTTTLQPIKGEFEVRSKKGNTLKLMPVV